MASRRNEIGVGCLLVVAAALLAFLALQVGALGALGRTIAVEARFADAGGLQEGATVAVAGVEVGKVGKLRIEHDVAVVPLLLDPAAKIRRDARVRVRARSVLGEKYVQVVPGSPDAPIAEDGDELASIGEQTEIDQLVNELGPVIRSLDPGAVDEAMGALSKALREDPERLARMLARADTILDNAAAASAELPALVSETRDTMARVRSTLAGVDARVAEAKGTLARADAVLQRADDALAPVPAVVADAGAAVADVRATLGDLDTAGADIRSILANLAEIDKYELRRLLREEGILLRMHPAKVSEEDQDWSVHGNIERRR